jgi:hypothetical protein
MSVKQFVMPAAIIASAKIEGDDRLAAEALVAEHSNLK